MINKIELQNVGGAASKEKMLQVIKNIQDNSYEYLKDANVKSLVIGISGGIDSAIVAALLRPVADRLGIRLIGRYISISTNSVHEMERAYMIGEFCHDFAEVDLTKKYNILKDIDTDDELFAEPELSYKIRMGNIKARMRMIYLYNLASKFKGLVLSTDNYTEYNVGFWTLAGDIGDFGPIQQLWKTEVYELADFLQQNFTEIFFDTDVDKKAMTGLIECIDANATDGLGITNSDLDQLTDKKFPSSQIGYKWVDNVLIAFLNNPLQILDGKIISRHLATAFKRNWPIVIKRNKIF